MPSDVSKHARVARDYYDSADANAFYERVWGGDDIHIGIYEAADESIASASRRTIMRLADKLGALPSRCRILDLGSGYGGAARFLANRFDADVTCINLSEVENVRARSLNASAGLDQQIQVFDASFEKLALESGTMDAAWSQDAFLHSERREDVLREVFRVLDSGARIVFTDPMRADDSRDEELEPILARLHLTSMACPAMYIELAEAIGFVECEFTDLSPQLTRHYTRVLEELERRDDELGETISRDYLDRAARGLRHWIEAGTAGRLAWGMFRFRKP